MADIKLFVCCHQENQKVPKHDLLYPIEVGSALHEKRFEGFLHDDEGENISRLNPFYCELTAQYWAWKNVQADYYGFFHYRRYLYPDATAKRPYRIEGELSQQTLKRLGYDQFSKIIEQYDMIVPKGEDMHVTVREHYASAPFHHVKDLELIETIIREKYPEFVDAMEQYLNGTVCYFGNIYIMQKQFFLEYCSWLFSVLEQFDQLADSTGYTAQERRVDGYLGERLFGIYYTYKKKTLGSIELPRVHFAANRREWIVKNTINLLSPPGSRVRAGVKFIVYKVKRLLH